MTTTPSIHLKQLLFFLVFFFSRGETIAQTKIDTTTASRYYKKADSLLEVKSYGESIHLFKKALPLYKKAEVWEKIASCYNKISENQWLTADFEKSYVNAHKALKIVKKYLNVNYSEEAKAYDNLGKYYEQKKVVDYKVALSYFKKALKIRKNAFSENHKDVAVSYHNIGILMHRQGLLDNALENYENALAIRLKVLGENNYFTTQSYGIIGYLYIHLGMHEKALENYQKALKIRTKLYGENHRNVSVLYGSIGNVYLLLSDIKQAEYNLKKQLKIVINTSDEEDSSIANSYYNIANFFRKIGSYKLAEDHYKEAQRRYTKIFGRESEQVGYTLFGLGSMNLMKNDSEIAIKNLLKAAQIYMVNSKNHYDLAKIYNAIGECYTNKRSYEKALQYFKKSLDISIKTFGQNHYQIATSYFYIGDLYVENKQYEKALDYYYKALEIELNYFGENHSRVATTNLGIGNVFLLKKEFSKAYEYYNKALNIYKRIFPEEQHYKVANSLDNLGILKIEEHKLSDALHYFQKSMNIRKKIFGKDNFIIAKSHNYLAQVCNKSEDYLDALKHYDTALQKNKKHTLKLQENIFDPNEYFETKFLVETLVGKARTFKNLFKQNQNIIEIKNSIKAYQKVDQLIHFSRQNLNNREDRITFSKKTQGVYKEAVQTELLLYKIERKNQSLKEAFYFSEKNKSNSLKESLSEANAKIFVGLPLKLINLEKELKTSYSFYTSEIIKERSEKNSDLKKITAYENRLFDITRRKDSLTKVLEKGYPKYYQLKHKKDIISVADIQEKLEDNTTLLEFFTADSITYAFTISKHNIAVQELETPGLTAQIEEFRESITTKNTTIFKQKGHTLYNKLIQPIKDKLVGDELIIIPDGPLWHLNFELLLSQNDLSKNPGELSYLLNEYAITYANSANLLFNSFKQDTSKDQQEGCLAFSFSDSTNAATSNNMSLATLRNAGDDLPGTRKEIRAIADIIDGQYYFGAEANEANFKKKAEQYKILHLALHGEVDNEKPENSKLFFTKSKDTIEDDLLYAHELFALDIPSDLTVLSACNTGTGKIAKGEGIMSLGNAFQYAGTKSLLLSSWEVPDDTAPELMQYFYTNLKAGMNKGKALQQAKLSYLETADRYHKAPFYWGGFYLVGDSAPIQFNTTNFWYWILGLGILGIILLGLLYKRKQN